MTTNSGNTEYLGTDQVPPYTPNGDERTLAILVHVLSIFFWFIPALIIYLMKKDDSPFVAEHAKEALNFQITLTILYCILFISIIGIVLMWIPGIFLLIFSIIAAIKASELKLYKFPVNWRIVK